MNHKSGRKRRQSDRLLHPIVYIQLLLDSIACILPWYARMLCSDPEPRFMGVLTSWVRSTPSEEPDSRDEWDAWRQTT